MATKSTTHRSYSRHTHKRKTEKRTLVFTVKRLFKMISVHLLKLNPSAANQSVKRR